MGDGASAEEGCDGGVGGYLLGENEGRNYSGPQRISAGPVRTRRARESGGGGG
jgi:hypothetical protein